MRVLEACYPDYEKRNNVALGGVVLCPHCEGPVDVRIQVEHARVALASLVLDAAEKGAGLEEILHGLGSIAVDGRCTLQRLERLSNDALAFPVLYGPRGP